MKPIKYLNTFDEVRALVNKVREKRIPGILGFEPFRQEYYRGEVSDTFVLKPSLARNFSDNDTLLKTEQVLMEDFKEQMSFYNKMDKVLLHDNPYQYQNEWSWLGQAQHYRLPTRMLDWTLKWEVALYFAVEEIPDFNSHDAQFWVFYVPEEIIMHDGKKDLYFQEDPLKLSKTWFVNPSFFWTDNQANETAETRRARQHGKFSIQAHSNLLTPLEQQMELIPHLEKYCIPADAKGQIRLELASKGIFGEFLYAKEDVVINNIISTLRTKYGLM